MTTNQDLGVSIGDPGLPDYPDVAEAWEGRDERFDPPEVTADGGMPDAYDPEAPWGRNPKTGRPYTKSPEERADIGRRLSEARRAAGQNGGAPRKRRGAAPRPPRSAQGRPRAPQGPDYRPAILGLLQLPAAGLGVLARFHPPFALDSAAIVLHAPPIADALHHLALDDPRVSAVLDKVMTVGPYGALIAAVSPLILQILCNHGVIGPNERIGALDEEQLMDAVIGVPPEES